VGGSWLGGEGVGGGSWKMTRGLSPRVASHILMTSSRERGSVGGEIRW
jgi:hypothetical protein